MVECYESKNGEKIEFGSLGLFGSKVTSHDLVSSALQAYMSIATAINHKFFNFIFSGIL